MMCASNIMSETIDSPTSTSSHSTNDETQEPLITFNHFHDLPTELQLKIWKRAIPGPRVIKLKTHDNPGPKTTTGKLAELLL